MVWCGAKTRVTKNTIKRAIKDEPKATEQNRRIVRWGYLWRTGPMTTVVINGVRSFAIFSSRPRHGLVEFMIALWEALMSKSYGVPICFATPM